MLVVLQSVVTLVKNVVEFLVRFFSQLFLVDDCVSLHDHVAPETLCVAVVLMKVKFQPTRSPRNIVAVLKCLCVPASETFAVSLDYVFCKDLIELFFELS